MVPNRATHHILPVIPSEILPKEKRVLTILITFGRGIFWYWQKQPSTRFLLRKAVLKIALTSPGNNCVGNFFQIKFQTVGLFQNKWEGIRSTMFWKFCCQDQSIDFAFNRVFRCIENNATGCCFWKFKLKSVTMQFTF